MRSAISSPRRRSIRPRSGSSPRRGVPRPAPPARDARSASVWGQTGRNMYHCPGSAASTPRGRRRSPGWRDAARPARCSRSGSAGRAPRDEAVVGGAAAGDRHHRRTGLGGQRRGPERQRGRLPAQLDRDVAAPEAAVAEEDEVLAVAQRPEDAAQVPPADEEDVLAPPSLLEVVVEAPVGRVVGDDVQALAAQLEPGADEVHAAHVDRAEQDALALGPARPAGARGSRCRRGPPPPARSSRRCASCRSGTSRSCGTRVVRRDWTRRSVGAVPSGWARLACRRSRFEPARS